MACYLSGNDDRDARFTRQETMDIYIKDKKLKAALEDEVISQRQYGADMTKKLLRRVAALRAADSLAVFWPPKSGPERVHELTANLKGTFSVDLKHPYRLLFKPIEDESDTPSSDTPSNDQHLRWQSIKAIELLRIEDTHE
ncbi:type II toxin-antitoxin system RelE/ParE family toxin [Pyxidicoccus sp. 3LG]